MVPHRKENKLDYSKQNFTYSLTYYFYIFLCFTAFSFFCLSFSSFVFFDYQTQLLLESVGKWASHYKLLHKVFSSLFIGKPTFAFFMWTRAPSAQSSICAKLHMHRKIPESYPKKKGKWKMLGKHLEGKGNLHTESHSGSVSYLVILLKLKILC